jgi:hypothetical protein
MKPLTPKQRSDQERKALEVYCREVAVECNNAGIGVRDFMKYFEIDMTQEFVKSVIRAVGFAKYGKASTKDLTHAELEGCWEEVNRRISVDGLYIPFPSRTGFTDEIINNGGYIK